MNDSLYLAVKIYPRKLGHCKQVLFERRPRNFKCHVVTLWLSEIRHGCKQARTELWRKTGASGALAKHTVAAGRSVPLDDFCRILLPLSPLSLHKSPESPARTWHSIKGMREGECWRSMG